MKKNTSILWVLCASSLLSSCANGPFDNSFTQAISPKNMPLFANNAKSNNGQIIGDLVVLNQNEITAAQEAQKKATNPQVRSYASFMYREHQKNLKETLNISQRIHSPSESSPTARTLENQGKSEMAQLQTLNKTNFDKAYIDAMVNDHKAALALMDQRLIPNSTNPQLTTHLKATRYHIAAHLKKVEMIQQRLNG